MRKGSGTKTKVSITLDKDLVRVLSKNCKKRTMKLSGYIEKLIKKGMKNEK